jgi:hypothetical protein
MDAVGWIFVILYVWAVLGAVIRGARYRGKR